MLMTRNVSSSSSRSGRVKVCMSTTLFGILRIDQLAIQQLAERAETLVTACQLEQRPAVLVQALFEEGRLRAASYDFGVSAFGLRIALGAEQDLTAAELSLIDQCAGTEAGDQPIECIESLLGLSITLVRARELVEHAIALAILRIRFEETECRA